MKIIHSNNPFAITPQLFILGQTIQYNDMNSDQITVFVAFNWTESPLTKTMIQTSHLIPRLNNSFICRFFTKSSS